MAFEMEKGTNNTELDNCQISNDDDEFQEEWDADEINDFLYAIRSGKHEE